MTSRYPFRSAVVIIALCVVIVLLAVRLFKSTRPYSTANFKKTVIYQNQKCFEASVVKVANGEEIWLNTNRRVVIQGADSPKGKDVVPAVKELEKLVLGRMVIVCPCESSPEDRHKRLRAQVFISGKSVAEHLLERCLVGLHYFYKCDSKIADELYSSYFEGWQSGLNLCKNKKFIQAKDAKAHIGSFAVVDGTITNTKTVSSPLIFNMEGLKVVIFRNDLYRLKSSGVVPESWAVGTRLKLFGQISDYNGAQMILRSARQVLEVAQ